MSEPIRTSPTRRQQLAAALKRNMARRKAGVSREASVVSAPGLAAPLARAVPAAAHGVEMHENRFSGEGMSGHATAAIVGKGTAL